MSEIPRRQLVMLDALAALALAFLPPVLGFGPGGTGEDVDVAAWSLSLAAALPLTLRRRWPRAVFAFVLTVALVAVPLEIAPTPILAAAYALYLVVVTGQWTASRSAVIVGTVTAAAAAVMTMVGGTVYRGDARLLQVVFGVLVLGATWAVGAAVKAGRDNVARAIREATERARVEERLGIARDVHDVVTHNVGAIVVKAGIANHVAASDYPDAAREALVVIEDVGRKALQDIRAMLKLLRGTEDEPPETSRAFGLRGVPDLVEAAEAAGVRVELTCRGTEEPPYAVSVAAFHVLQEALTNVIKYAAPTRCTVTVVAHDGTVRVEVADEGATTTRASAVPGSGVGLVGASERVTAHGGTLVAAPYGSGFRVQATLPY